MNRLLTLMEISNWGTKSGFVTFQVLLRLKFQRIKKIKEIAVTERHREYAIIINISINDHNTKILFPQKVTKKR